MEVATRASSESEDEEDPLAPLPWTMGLEPRIPGDFLDPQDVPESQVCEPSLEVDETDDAAFHCNEEVRECVNNDGVKLYINRPFG